MAILFWSLAYGHILALATAAQTRLNVSTPGSTSNAVHSQQGISNERVPGQEARRSISGFDRLCQIWLENTDYQDHLVLEAVSPGGVPQLLDSSEVTPDQDLYLDYQHSSCPNFRCAAGDIDDPRIEGRWKCCGYPDPGRYMRRWRNSHDCAFEGTIVTVSPSISVLGILSTHLLHAMSLGVCALTKWRLTNCTNRQAHPMSILHVGGHSFPFKDYSVSPTTVGIPTTMTILVSLSGLRSIKTLLNDGRRKIQLLSENFRMAFFNSLDQTQFSKPQYPIPTPTFDMPKNHSASAKQQCQKDDALINHLNSGWNEWMPFVIINKMIN